jgi:hypothetical protein
VWVHQAAVVNGQAVPVCQAAEPVSGLAGWQAVKFPVTCEECADIAAIEADDEGFYDAVNEPLVVWR